MRVVNPHFLLGGGVSIPIVKGTTQVDTSFAVGLYWDVDLRRERSFAEGNHLLITLGTNVFSLLGAQSKK